MRPNLIAAFLATTLAVAPSAHSQGLVELARLDRLPLLKTSVRIGSVSSYDRTGGNDDGFSGKYSFVRKEGPTLVLADLDGPGVIYRFATPTPTDDIIEFFFDGEATPRLRVKFVDLFTGSKSPFVTPLVGYGSGGFFSYVPLPYQKSCKIRLAPREGATEAKMQFYQINFATYPAGTSLTSFYPTLYADASSLLDRARRVLAMTGSDLSAVVSPGGVDVRVVRTSQRIEPGKTATLFETDRPGRIVGVRLSPAGAMGGKDRGLVVRMYWDGDPKPAVESPVSDFFGYSWGQPATRSLLLGTVNDANYVYLPMPFDRSAKIELAWDVDAASVPSSPLDVTAEVAVSDRARDAQTEGRFYAAWRRENPTTIGRPFTFVDLKGRGHIVAALLQSQGLETGTTEFFEGDDEVTVDGELVVRGTGSEDAFNGGWYDVPGRWEARASYPLSGCLDYKKYLGRTGAYRFFIGDTYAFRQSVYFTIEHAGEGNRLPTDYVGVTMLYAQNRPEGLPVLPSIASRRVVDPERITFSAGWSLPIHAFSFEHATIARTTEKFDGKELRYFSMKAESNDIFGPHFVSFLCELPRAGKYRISIEGVAGPAQGRVQLFRDEQPVADAVDFYAADRKPSPLIPVGTLEMVEGVNQVFFKLVGKNERAAGLGFDLARVICERLPD